MDKEKDMPRCPECGERFQNVFDASDHLLEDDDESFDPALILPNGYKLMIGSLLRCLYDQLQQGNIKEADSIIQSAYMTLFTAEMSPDIIGEIVQDMAVKNEMFDFDKKLRMFLDDNQENRG